MTVPLLYREPSVAVQMGENSQLVAFSPCIGLTMPRSTLLVSRLLGIVVVIYIVDASRQVSRATVILAGVEDRKGTTVVVVGDGLSVLSDLPTMLLAGQVGY